MAAVLLQTVDRLRAGDLDPRAAQRVLAELEFDLADRLADGPFSVELETIRLILRPGLEHRELKVVLDLLVSPPPNLRTALWLADLAHVEIRRGPRTATGSARKRLAPEAPVPLRPPLPPGDLRRLAEDDRLGWMEEAEAIRAERGTKPEPLSDPPRPTPARWRRFVHIAVTAQHDPETGPNLGLVCAAYDDLLRQGDVPAAACIQSAARTAKGPGAGALRQALDCPDRVATRMKLDRVLASDTPSVVLVSMLDRDDPVARCMALSILTDRKAPEASPALIAVLRSDAFHHRPIDERRAFLRALPVVDERATNPLLLGLLEVREKRNEEVAQTQVLAVELLGERWTATVDAGLRRVSRGFGLHRDVRRAVKAVLSAAGS